METNLIDRFVNTIRKVQYPAAAINIVQKAKAKGAASTELYNEGLAYDEYFYYTRLYNHLAQGCSTDGRRAVCRVACGRYDRK